MPETQPFRAEDMLKQATIQDLTISPDGETVVFGRRVIVDNGYRSQLWRVPYAGGEAVQLTHTAGSNGRPRFSPDGQQILFLSDRGGRSEPWVMPISGGEPRRVVKLTSYARSAEWSPDGTKLVIIALSGEDRFIVGKSDDPTARRITSFTWRRDGYGIRDQFASAYVVAVNDDEQQTPLRITAPDYEVMSAFWSPDGERIGFLADLSDDASFDELPQAWALPARGGGEPEAIGQLSGAIWVAAWSGSGQLAALGVDIPKAPSWANMGLFVVNGGTPRRLGADLDRPICNTSFGDLIDPFSGPTVHWQDADHLLGFVTDGGRSLPYRFGVSDGSVERLADGEIVCTSIASGGGKIVSVASDRGRSGEVYAVENGGLRALTTIGSDWLAPYRRDPERVQISHPDGTTFDAWYIPATGETGNARPGPLAIQIHGGPHASHGPTPYLEMLALADAGIHVLYPNPRGSTGYGEAFTTSIHGAHGDLDGDDILRLVDWAVEEGIADRKRIGIFGLSYGGVMTNRMLGRAPGVFAAAVSENPITDAISWYGSSDHVAMTDVRFGGIGQLPEDINEFLTRSAFMKIHRNEAPLLLLHADNDLVCPPHDSELVFAILRSRGCTVEMIRYPNEGHYMVGVGRPDRRVDRMQRTVDWFERYL